MNRHQLTLTSLLLATTAALSPAAQKDAVDEATAAGNGR
jgi:hypothetical protein